ncbi:hydantoinase/oxoprolinase family protein [Pusillimonas noertemannii]|uniref:N-methylhydantoinase A n=1 Tax=Pusillimonas noertemannii TaxID=305977 RepID=A0A2U1CNG8_9BURK|nr:hydantoinase/oxoprolinase family protein [Pusillimonas noertemannii]NYT68420.1 hydantoinase/oxoprolinase family protein [Pusillimonas noertemannii]PVY62563.1 N-methylhydantoinase A [Pusillimonas noertemannii]TFL10488.1 hydantoinase/oxoprolinase family protein [Pusillimonas noertemannii]
MYLGIDIGGTFTDLVLMDANGHVTTTKAPTTPGELQKGLFEAIDLAAASVGLTRQELLAKVVTFGHGTTQATNALIERDGASTGLITTMGFGDTLALQRLKGFTAGVPSEQLGWYSKRRHPEPIVPRHLIEEVRERVDHAGRVILPLDEDGVRESIARLLARKVETFAVSLLWSFRHPRHEQRIRELIHEQAPDAYVSLSCEVAPVMGEYERTATTALNSYLAVKVVSYLGKIEALLREHAFRGNFFILNSAGGVMPSTEAGQKPVALVTSGPTGGVMGSLELALAMGHENVITTDMGGTSFDVAMIVNGVPVESVNHEAAGFHLCSPMIDIRAIGAGGGSIARVNDGLLQVGPESASARPGPVCYGRGGKLVTTTDADVVLGIIDPDNFLGGRMKLDREAAAKAIEEQIAKPLGLSIQEAAAGIRRIVDDHMADTLREVTIGRGHDPRDFVLFAYGGAGPVHCAGFGAELGVRKIIVPATSMAHSAYGALASDIYKSVELSEPMPCASSSAERIDAIFNELEREACTGILRAGIKEEDTEVVRSAGMLYHRQVNDLSITFPSGTVDANMISTVTRKFEDAYERAYGEGSGFSDARIDLSVFRVKAIGRTRKPDLAAQPVTGLPMPKLREIYEPRQDKAVSAQIWQWLTLPVGHEVIGPAVIEHPETAVFVGAGQRASLDEAGNLAIESVTA